MLTADQAAEPVDVPSDGSDDEPGRSGANPVVVLGVLSGMLLVACIAASAIGAFSIPVDEILSSVLHRIGIEVGSRPDELAESVLWRVRFSRVALAVVVGASLGAAGASMQGTFANPLAEPGIVGVSSGAVVGAAFAIVIGVSTLGIWTVPIMAFVAGMITVVGVYLAARSEGRTEVVTLVLTGIAVNSFAGALIGLATFLSTDAELRSITFWTLGSVAQATWAKVAVVTPLAILGLVVAVSRSRELDLLALGEGPARHLGVPVERLRITMLAVVALLTAAAVAVSGVVLFVGLVIPHLVRAITGPGHRLLLPASALAGAFILVVGDLVARTVVAPAEIPLGVLTSLIGSPFFFWQLRRTRARQGGWA